MLRASAGAGRIRSVAERIAGTVADLRRRAAPAGNRVELLESAGQYFPALLEAIAGARRSVHLETYIFADDRVGEEVREALLRAARRGVEVRLLVDAFGGGEHARRLQRELAAAGAQARLYRPERGWRLQRRRLRRLHRKIAVIDDRAAFVGGINIDADPPADGRTGEPIGPRLDFAVRCEGPIVAAISLAVRRLWWAVGMAQAGLAGERRPRRLRAEAALAGGVSASFVPRDNLRHRHAIERAYLKAIAAAQCRIDIACAYFLPGRRFRRALVRAARRGVRVRLLLQGRVEYRLQHGAQRALYGGLLRAGIEIQEYRRGYLHAKAAVVDEAWATVGSSNIDPLSLLLAREANVVVRDGAFCARLRGAIDAAAAAGARPLDPGRYARRARVQRALDWLAYGLVRAAAVWLARGDDY